MDQPRLLLVDDDIDLLAMMREYLEPEGFRVDVAHDGAAFWEAGPQAADLVALDVMLPRKSGFELLKQFRRDCSVPVILLTARDNDVDRVVGLEIGADDYVSKPFNPRELVARIRAVLRRSAAPAAPAEGLRRVRVRDVELDPGARAAWRGGRPLDLTTAEFNLLDFFLRRPGEVVGRDDLSAAAFGRQGGARNDRNVDTLVSKLRRKLDPEGAVECRIKTVRNAGYVYAIPDGDG